MKDVLVIDYVQTIPTEYNKEKMEKLVKEINEISNQYPIKIILVPAESK